MTRNLQRFVLAAFVLLSGVGFVSLLVVWTVPEVNVRILDLCAGIMLGWGGQAMTFYFGTSAGSVAKSEQIERMTKDNPDV